MQGFGARLAARARELGFSNAEVARRAGLSERRFGNYVTDTREPDLHTLRVLAGILAITSDELLGLTAPKAMTGRERLLARIGADLGQVTDADLKLISIEVRAVAVWRRETAE